MFKLSSDALRLLKKPWLWATAIILSAAVWAVCFYWAAQPRVSQTLTVWIGSEREMSVELSSEIKRIGDDYGMKHVSISSYNPSDGQYAAAFALQTANVDVYILKRDEATVTAQAGVFMSLNDRADYDGVVKYNDDVIGVMLDEEYCVLLNAQSKKSKKLLFGVFDTIIAHGAFA